MPNTASARSGWASDAEHDRGETGEGGDRDDPLQRRADRVEDRHRLDRQRHGGQGGDVLIAHDVDHLLAGDLHRTAGADEPGVGVGDDVGEELGGLRVGERAS